MRLRFQMPEGKVLWNILRSTIAITRPSGALLTPNPAALPRFLRTGGGRGEQASCQCSSVLCVTKEQVSRGNCLLSPKTNFFQHQQVCRASTGPHTSGWPRLEPHGWLSRWMQTPHLQAPLGRCMAPSMREGTPGYACPPSPPPPTCTPWGEEALGSLGPVPYPEAAGPTPIPAILGRPCGDVIVCV